MIDISQLARYDIKNIRKDIEFKSLKEKFFYRPAFFLNIGLVIVTLLIANNMFTKKKMAAGNLRQQVEESEKKLQAVEELLANQKELNSYVENTPQGISADEIIDLVTDLSSKHGLQILSFSPAKKESKPLYEMTSVRINVSAENYKNLWIFVRDLENSEKSLRIKSWAGRIDEPATRMPQTLPNVEAEEKKAVYAQIEINSLQLKK